MEPSIQITKSLESKLKSLIQSKAINPITLEDITPIPNLIQSPKPKLETNVLYCFSNKNKPTPINDNEAEYINIWLIKSLKTLLGYTTKNPNNEIPKNIEISTIR